MLQCYNVTMYTGEAETEAEVAKQTESTERIMLKPGALVVSRVPTKGVPFGACGCGVILHQRYGYVVPSLEQTFVLLKLGRAAHWVGSGC